MTQYPRLEKLKEAMGDYHPAVQVIFDNLNDNNKIFIMKQGNSYTVNDMSSGSFLIGDSKIDLLVDFIEDLQKSIVNKHAIKFKRGKIDKSKLTDFTEKIMHAKPLNELYVQELMEIFPYYFTPHLLITTLLKDFLPAAGKLQKSIFSKLGMSAPPEPIVPKSVNVEKIVVNILDNAPLNEIYHEESESVKKVFTLLSDNNTFYKKHISEHIFIESITNYTKKRAIVFENLNDINLEQSIFKIAKDILPKENWRDISNCLPSFPKKSIASQNIFEIEDTVTIKTKISKETIFNKYNEINTEFELDRMISTLVSIMNENKPKEIESIVIKNTASTKHALLFISGKNMSKDYVIKVMDGLNDLMESYDNLEMGLQEAFDTKWEEGKEYLSKLAHSFWINFKINEVKEVSPKRTKTRKI